LLEDARVFYAARLRENPEVLSYLRDRRSLSDATIEAFGLGYAPRSFDDTRKHFTQRGYREQDLLDAGLASERQEEPGGGTPAPLYDRFRHRIMIPIRDENGRMAGFGARVVNSDDVPKFLNSPETPVFTKGRLLYGLDRARKSIRAADQAVIVEGYLDVIALHQSGYENVVSPMGTALTEDQLRLLKRFTRRIVLALDPDAAGQKAVLRGLEAARQAMDREGELRFDARGLLRNEARLQADLRVATMPDGLDPDEIVKRDRDEWKRLIETSEPVIEHVMHALAQDRDLSDRNVTSEISAQVLPLIQDLPKPEEREFYVQKLARFLRIDERAFLGSLTRGGAAPRRRRLPASESGGHAEPLEAPGISAARRKIEAHVLAWLFRQPELVYRADRLLQQHGLAALAVEDFAYTDAQLVFGLIRQAVEQDETDQHSFVEHSLPESLLGFSQELVQLTDDRLAQEEKILEELLRGVRRMREDAASERLTHYRFLQEEAQEQGDLENATEYQGEVLKLTQLKRVLDQFDREMTLKRMR
jgi:DNA primase